MLANLRSYEAEGNELQGRNLTMDRGYTGYDVVARNQFSYNFSVW